MIDRGVPPRDAAMQDGDHRWSRWVRDLLSLGKAVDNGFRRLSLVSGSSS
jgi:hypothetical protein